MGWRNFIASIAIVATGPFERREATMPAAMSIWLKIQPPKIWPLALMSPGPGMTLRIGTRSQSLIPKSSFIVTFFADVGRRGIVVAARVAQEHEGHQRAAEQHGQPDAERGGDDQARVNLALAPRHQDDADGRDHDRQQGEQAKDAP